jgi:hypothetical protein
MVPAYGCRRNTSVQQKGMKAVLHVPMKYFSVRHEMRVAYRPLQELLNVARHEKAASLICNPRGTQRVRKFIA